MISIAPNLLMYYLNDRIDRLKATPACIVGRWSYGDFIMRGKYEIVLSCSGLICCATFDKYLRYLYHAL